MLIKLLHWTLRKLGDPFKEKFRNSKLGFLWILYVNLLLKLNGEVYFGQNKEDLVLAKYLTERKGAYVDIGAGWPIRGSNTFYFYKKGWVGHTIDPIKSNMKLHKLFRPRDCHIQALIGDVRRVVDFYIFDPYEYSTSNPEVVNSVEKLGQARLVKIQKLKMRRLDELQIYASPFQPTLLSIDVEGNDLEVLKSINWNEYLPRVICIEILSDGSDSAGEILDFLQNLDYAPVSRVSVSRIFVHSSYLQTQN